MKRKSFLFSTISLFLGFRCDKVYSFPKLNLLAPLGLTPMLVYKTGSIISTADYEYESLIQLNMDSNVNDNQLRKKLIKSKSGLRIVLVNEKYRSPFLLCEPEWVPDNEVTHCTSCKRKFNLTTRKHHCRRCGRIFCSSCCCSKMALPRMSFVDPVRVCDSCALITERESEFFDRRIKTLTNGATFLLSPLSSSNTTCLCLCKLSNDHQYLQFDSAANLPPLPLDSVTSFNVEHDLNSGSSYVQISFENGGFRLTTGPETTKLQGIEWIEAIHEAFTLIDINSTEN